MQTLGTETICLTESREGGETRLVWPWGITVDCLSNKISLLQNIIHSFNKNFSECLFRVRTTLHTKMTKINEDDRSPLAMEQSDWRGRSAHTLS